MEHNGGFYVYSVCQLHQGNPFLLTNTEFCKVDYSLAAIVL